MPRYFILDNTRHVVPATFDGWLNWMVHVKPLILVEEVPHTVYTVETLFIGQVADGDHVDPPNVFATVVLDRARHVVRSVRTATYTEAMKTHQCGLGVAKAMASKA
jgi:hypothetical protein